MVCPNCGANSASGAFCTVCGARLSSASSASGTTVKAAPVYTGGGTLTRKQPIISSSFIAGTVFAIIGCVCYMIFMYAGFENSEEYFIRNFANSFIGTRDESIAWIYMISLFSVMVLFPVGLVMFSAGAENGKATGINVIITALVIQLICSAINMFYFCSEMIPQLGDMFESFGKTMDYVSDSSVKMTMFGTLFLVLFFTIVHPIFFVIWISTAIHGVNRIGRNIKFRSNSFRPASAASSLGITIGVMRILLLIVIFTMLSDSNDVDEITESTEGLMMILGYLSLSVMAIAFGSYFGRMRKGDNFYSDTVAPRSVSYTTETYSSDPVATTPVTPVPNDATAIPVAEPVKNAADKFCIYCGRPLSESELCTCIEARMNADREIPAADHTIAENAEYTGPSRVSINIKHRPAPGSAEAKEIEEGAKMFSTPGDL